MGNTLETAVRGVIDAFYGIIWGELYDARERRVYENTIEEIYPRFTDDLDELVQLKSEKKVVETNRYEIGRNALFVYTIQAARRKKVALSTGNHVTNCLNCYVTCHENCSIPKNEDKHECVAMNSSGRCTRCSEKCHWTAHANTPFIWRYVEETITMTFAEKQTKYRKIPGEDMTVSKVLDRMGDHVVDLKTQIHTKMSELRVNINLLRRVSSRHDSMSVHDQIELLIRSERVKREPNYELRIETLIELRG